MNSKQALHASFLVFLCFFGSVAGSWLGAGVRSERERAPISPPPVSSPDAAPDFGLLLAEVRALRAELPPQANLRTSAGPASVPGASEQASIQERLSTLVGALELQNAALASKVPLSEIARGPARRTTASLFPEMNPDGKLPEGFGYEERRDALSAQHLLWSLPQILAEYGAPQQIYASEVGLQLEYAIGLGDSTCTFYFCEGIVTHVDF